MRIIPAIDILDGKCVRLTKGDYSTKVIYNENPLETAKQFEAAGIEYLHLYDLDGSKAKQIVNYKILEQIASKTSLKIDFGGGLRADEDLHIAFNSGARQIIGGSIAVKDSKTFSGWIEKYGGTKIMLGADCKNDKVKISGWQEDSAIDVISFIKGYQKKSIKYVVCKDVYRNGTLEGPSIELYQKIIDSCSNSESQTIKLIASGGVSCIEDINALEDIGCEAVIIGKALYEGKINLRDLETHI